MLQPSRDLRQGGLAGVGGQAEHPLGNRRDEKRDEELVGGNIRGAVAGV